MKKKQKMTNEQIRHWSSVIQEIATGQFLFFGGKNLYLYAKEIDYTWAGLIYSALVYLALHAIINFILADVED